MIEPPKKNANKEVARAIVEALAQATPITSFLARLYQTTHPSETEQDRLRWSVELTDRVNDLPALNDLRQLSEELKAVPLRTELQRTRPIIAKGTIEPNSGFRGYGVSSIADIGTGEWTVNLIEAAECTMDDPYHVSVELPEGRANVFNKSLTRFEVRTSESAEAIDTPINFVVIS